jgi:hypothetical protein
VLPAEQRARLLAKQRALRLLERQRNVRAHLLSTQARLPLDPPHPASAPKPHPAGVTTSQPTEQVAAHPNARTRQRRAPRDLRRCHVQDRVMGMRDTEYRSFQRDVKRYLDQLDRAAQDAHGRLWGERLAAIRNARSAISVMVRA